MLPLPEMTRPVSEPPERGWQPRGVRVLRELYPFRGAKASPSALFGNKIGCTVENLRAQRPSETEMNCEMETGVFEGVQSNGKGVSGACINGVRTLRNLSAYNLD